MTTHSSLPVSGSKGSGGGSGLPQGVNGLFASIFMTFSARDLQKHVCFCYFGTWRAQNGNILRGFALVALMVAGSTNGGQSCGTSRPSSGRPINSSLRTNFLKPSSARTFGILVGRLGVHCDLAHVLSFWCWGEQSVARAHATGGRRKYEWRSELWNKSSYQWAADQLKPSFELSKTILGASLWCFSCYFATICEYFASICLYFGSNMLRSSEGAPKAPLQRGEALPRPEGGAKRRPDRPPLRRCAPTR